MLMLALAVAGGTAAADEPTPTADPGATGADSDGKTLTAAEVGRYADGYVPAVKQCYLTHTAKAKGATGAVRLELIIHRDGSVFALTVVAPGVTGKALRKLDGCVQKQAASWHFPVRRGFTSVVIPFVFQRARRGGGPQPSCWSARGCPGQGDKQTGGAP